MVIKGRARGGAQRLAMHLMRLDTNERMEVLEARGVIATDLVGALREMEAVASGTKSQRPLYHASINTRADEVMTPEQWQYAVDRLSIQLGLGDQPRVVVQHAKGGRAHVHVVWSRIDTARMMAIHDGHNFRMHEEVARALEREFGHARVQGAHAERDKSVQPRPERTPYTWETQQHARTRGLAIAAITAEATAAWRAAESGAAFRAAIEARGYVLARGDRRDFVLVDARGGVHSLARRIEGVRVNQLRVRMAAFDLAAFPDVASARALQNEREASRVADVLSTLDVPGLLGQLLHQRSWFTASELHRALEDDGIRDLPAAASFVLGRSEVFALREGNIVIGYTTYEVRAQEEAVVARARRLDERAGVRVAPCYVTEAGRDCGLDVEQAAALRHALAPGGFKIIEGRAGTGKSHTLKALRIAAEAAGVRVVGLAPTNAVAQDLRDVGFVEASTVHSLLWYREHVPDHARAHLDQRTVLVVDEAAMLSTDVLDRLTRAAEATDAKLVLVGDDRQLGSIERGGVFTDIVARVGSARLETVRRQEHGWARDASRAFVEGQFDVGLRAYAERGLVDWSDNLEGARQRLVAQWAADTAEKRGKRLVFAYTNEEVDRLNVAIQAVEVARGRVGKLEAFETERGVVHLGEGDRIVFRGTDKQAGIHAGTLGTVETIAGGVLNVRSDAGRPIRVDTNEFTQFSLGYAGTIHRGQGKTLDSSYLLHTRHWRDAASYVAMTRARRDARVFVARSEAADLADLARQMARQQNRGSTLSYAAGLVMKPGLAASREVERSVQRGPRRHLEQHRGLDREREDEMEAG